MDKYIFYLMEQIPFPQFQLLGSKILIFCLLLIHVANSLRARRTLFSHFLYLHHSTWTYKNFPSSPLDDAKYLQNFKFTF